MKLQFAGVSAIALAVVLAGVTMPYAGGHSPVEKREAVMKVMGGSAKTIGDMLKGETAFDAAAANEALVAMQAAIAGFGDHFPEGTELAGENSFAAGPAIWTDPDGFAAEIATVTAAIDAAVAAAPQDAAALGAAFGTIGKSCGSCHEGYRVKK